MSGQLDVLPSFNIQGTLGALFLGVFISIFFFGICTLQMYMYFLNFPSDPLLFKFLVGFVWLCELAHSIFICHFIYLWTILQYGDPVFLLQPPPPSLTITIIISAFVGAVVQTFLAERIRLVSEGRILVPIICWISTFALFAMVIFLYAQGERASSLPAFQNKCRWIIIAVLSLSAALDVLEAVSLCYYLSKLRKLSMGRTAVNIHTIMRWTMETGLLKSMSEVSMLICFLLMPHNFVWLTIYICITRFHSNTFLASLNSRTILQKVHIHRKPDSNSNNPETHVPTFTELIMSV